MAKVKRSILWNIGRRKMNKSKIEWCDHTWNPITGCRHNCNYCYAKRMVVRFAGDIRMNKMAKGDYSTYLSADRSGKLYVLDKPMKNETENRIVYPFGFEPTLHRYRFEMPGKLKTGNNIFVGAMADIFGEWVPNDWIDEVMEVCKNNQYIIIYFSRKIRRGMNNTVYQQVPKICGLEPQLQKRKRLVAQFIYRRSVKGLLA